MSPTILFLLSFVPSLALPAQAGFILLIQKDYKTLQYTTLIYLKTPLQQTQVVFDLGGDITWIDCYKNYKSSTYHLFPCNGSQFCDSLPNTGVSICTDCSDNPGIPCANNTCGLFAENPVAYQGEIGVALTDVLKLPTTNGSTQGPLSDIKNHVFSCAPSSVLPGLSKSVSGSLALGQSIWSLQTQISNSSSSYPNYFAVCLSGSRTSPGVAFLAASGPYIFLPGIDLSRSLTYTPIISNVYGGPFISSVAVGREAEYFIGVTSININNKPVPLYKQFLAINGIGIGGTKISTVYNYTSLQRSIYTGFTETFVNQSSAMNLALTKPVKPFSFCYGAKDVQVTPTGPKVPTIDLVLQSKDVYWRIYGSNSMVRVTTKNADVWCLGFLDGGVNQRQAIVIGGYQIEDNLLQFGLGSKRLGFSSSLLQKGTTCANFKFTKNPTP
ncbi:hypothetical protein Tsubulata_045995 [Turnera subulata]|uniref:Peptidase A1 domain-containing protein n=1 Tax=Turnera subulata TaxID=218843 RepID=A0A9Q0JNE3_9ROSI|nr:hypothetical protein Tsubulata_045995 [Turnera subulata]